MEIIHLEYFTDNLKMEDEEIITTQIDEWGDTWFPDQAI